MADARRVSSILEDTSIHLGDVLDALNVFSEEVEDELNGWIELTKDPALKRFKSRYEALHSVLNLVSYRIVDIATGLEDLASEFRNAGNGKRKAAQEQQGT